MTYEYECKSGHVTEIVQSVNAPRPKFVKCACGKRAKRIMSKPTFGMNLNGKHGTVDSTERAYGSIHTKGLIDQRETTEHLIAMGVSDGHKGDGKSSWALPTVEGVQAKKEQYKHGVKPPESATFGVKREVLENLGIA